MFRALICLSLLLSACGPEERDRRGERDTPDASSKDPDAGDEESPADAGEEPLPDAGSVMEENTNARCSDGEDNDGDGHYDCNDFDCSRNPFVTVCAQENTDALCSDGLDNDSDGYPDCDDYDCARNPNVSVCLQTCEECTDTALSGACNSAWIACASKVACQSLVQCVEGCGSQSCVDACASNSPEGVSLLNPVLECLDTECAGVCN